MLLHGRAIPKLVVDVNIMAYEVKAGCVFVQGEPVVPSLPRLHGDPIGVRKGGIIVPGSP
jgi:hypothetical protein